ncbi:MAG: hypothetical protein JNM00_16130, partial [Flavobacteriales bacterium]|nr:hypothetical protein [Flavobacteriales bacterium]
TDGSTDNTFDNDGIATAGFIEFSNDRAFAVALQPDGKIVLGGYYSAGSMNRDFAMIRFNPDGVLDPSFGGGSITSAIDVGDDEIQSLLVQDDGKIVAGGYSFNFATRVFVIARYNPDGSPDSDFGNAGVATTTFTENDDAAYALAQQPDGKYILAGYTHGDTYDFALARYNTDGSPDITFGVDGKVVTPIGDANEEARALTIQSDGNILVAGFSYDYWEYFAIARYNPDGSLDSSFGTDGKVITNIDGEGNYDWIHSIALQSDGKILVAGRSETEDEGSVFAVARYHNLGSVAISAWPGAPVAISAYPMPCHDELFFNPVPAHFAVTMYNVQGQMISGLITTSTGIKLPPDLPAGIYNLHIRSGEHEARLSICKE